MDWRPWMDAFLPPLLEALPGRVAFVGIQGSFGRGEAGRRATWTWWWCWTRWGRRSWPPAGVCWRRCPSLTGPAASSATGGPGCLARLRRPPAQAGHPPGLRLSGGTAAPHGEGDAGRGRSAAASALYHAACHTALFDAQPEAALPALQKAAFFALRLAHCRRSGQYTAARQSLLPKLEPEERALLGKDCTLPALMAWARGEMES